MNSDLEALVLALDALIEARGGNDAEKLDGIYQARVEDVLARFPHLSRERLIRAVDFAHRKWQHAHQKKPPSIPPKA